MWFSEFAPDRKCFGAAVLEAATEQFILAEVSDVGFVLVDVCARVIEVYGIVLRVRYVLILLGSLTLIFLGHVVIGYLPRTFALLCVGVYIFGSR
jgi:hypothetical protein